VLLIEAGPTDVGVRSISDPLIWYTNIDSPYDWKYRYAPSPATRDRELLIPRGKVLGGSSSINALIWVRGDRSDSDHWAQNGAPGWAFKDVLPYFKKAEDWQLGDSALRGAGGPLHCELPDAPHEIAAGLVESAKSLGLPVAQDVNGDQFGCASLANLNIKDGARDNTARAYLRPAMSRPNLTVLTGSQALRLVFAGPRCAGVQVSTNSGIRALNARREVVLSAGAIDTPRLLLLSGVGNSVDLEALRIPVVADLKGVGENLHDHPLLMGVNFEATGSLVPYRDNSGGSQAFWKSRSALKVPDIMVVPIQIPYASQEITKLYPVAQNAFAITPGLMQPASRGRLKLRSAEPNGPLEIQPNFLQERTDIEALMGAVGFCLELGAQPPLRAIAKQPVCPPRSLVRRELEEFVRLTCSSYFHPVGTCRMGTDARAVVDPELKVHGLEGLRIADASIMPRIPTSNTHAPSVMIGERAADFLRNARG
jgi:choline dehydrogenase